MLASKRILHLLTNSSFSNSLQRIQQKLNDLFQDFDKTKTLKLFFALLISFSKMDDKQLLTMGKVERISDSVLCLALSLLNIIDNASPQDFDCIIRKLGLKYLDYWTVLINFARSLSFELPLSLQKEIMQQDFDLLLRKIWVSYIPVNRGQSQSRFILGIAFNSLQSILYDRVHSFSKMLELDQMASLTVWNIVNQAMIMANEFSSRIQDFNFDYIVVGVFWNQNVQTLSLADFF